MKRWSIGCWNIGRGTICLMVGVSLGSVGCRQPMHTAFAERLPDMKIAAPVGTAAGCTPALTGLHPRYDLNRVSLPDLEQLPAMTPVLARQVIAGRPYPVKRALLTRHVLTAEQYQRWKDYLVVHRVVHRGVVRPRAVRRAR